MNTTPFSEADILRHICMQCRSTGTQVRTILHNPFVKVEQIVEEICMEQPRVSIAVEYISSLRYMTWPSMMYIRCL